MKKIKSILIIMSLCAFSVGASTTAQDYPTSKKTADSQMKGTDADVAVTRKIRDRLTEMDELSVRAQNITILTVGNEVTLKGEVAKRDEIKKVLDVVQQTASGKEINNQLSVYK